MTLATRDRRREPQEAPARGHRRRGHDDDAAAALSRPPARACSSSAPIRRATAPPESRRCARSSTSPTCTSAAPMPAVLEPLLATDRGDRARRGGRLRRPHAARQVAEFRAGARLSRAHRRCRKVIVPGNHDVPLYRVLGALPQPARQVSSATSATTSTPSFVDDEIAVVGINTARSLTFKSGRINEEQMAEIHRPARSDRRGGDQDRRHPPSVRPARRPGRRRARRPRRRGDGGVRALRRRHPARRPLPHQPGRATPRRGTTSRATRRSSSRPAPRRRPAAAARRTRSTCCAWRSDEVERRAPRLAAGDVDASRSAGTERFVRDGRRWIER